MWPHLPTNHYPPSTCVLDFETVIVANANISNSNTNRNIINDFKSRTNHEQSRRKSNQSKRETRKKKVIVKETPDYVDQHINRIYGKERKFSDVLVHAENHGSKDRVAKTPIVYLYG